MEVGLRFGAAVGEAQGSPPAAVDRDRVAPDAGERLRAGRVPERRSAETRVRLIQPASGSGSTGPGGRRRSAASRGRGPGRRLVLEPDLGHVGPGAAGTVRGSIDCRRPSRSAFGDDVVPARVADPVVDGGDGRIAGRGCSSAGGSWFGVPGVLASGDARSIGCKPRARPPRSTGERAAVSGVAKRRRSAQYVARGGGLTARTPRQRAARGSADCRRARGRSGPGVRFGGGLDGAAGGGGIRPPVAGRRGRSVAGVVGAALRAGVPVRVAGRFRRSSPWTRLRRPGRAGARSPARFAWSAPSRAAPGPPRPRRRRRRRRRPRRRSPALSPAPPFRPRACRRPRRPGRRESARPACHRSRRGGPRTPRELGRTASGRRGSAGASAAAARGAAGRRASSRGSRRRRAGARARAPPRRARLAVAEGREQRPQLLAATPVLAAGDKAAEALPPLRQAAVDLGLAEAGDLADLGVGVALAEQAERTQLRRLQRCSASRLRATTSRRSARSSGPSPRAGTRPPGPRRPSRGRGGRAAEVRSRLARTAIASCLITVWVQRISSRGSSVGALVSRISRARCRRPRRPRRRASSGAPCASGSLVARDQSRPPPACARPRPALASRAVPRCQSDSPLSSPCPFQIALQT